MVKSVKEYAKRRWYIDMSNKILTMAGNTTLPIEKISGQSGIYAGNGE